MQRRKGLKICYHFTGRKKVIEFIILSRIEGVKGNTEVFFTGKGRVNFIVRRRKGLKIYHHFTGRERVKCNTKVFNWDGKGFNPLCSAKNDKFINPFPPSEMMTNF